ncbi:tetratricopeptide repeat protein [Akkermansiaceae bacterium]|nr:tetratricopeptide repeat protein [Akkermansiaceae bacterium]
MTARLLLFLLFTSFSHANLSTLQQIDLATFEKMREVERYQIKIAEKHFLKGSFKVALAEYEKFLTLYEKSPGAPYAQLMWSHTMMNLKKPKTALRDGFQSVIDYWPESHEATIAAYCMGDAYRTMGEVKDAQKSFRFLIKEYPGHEIAIRARQDLLHYARLHQDMDERLALLNELTFKVERTEKSKEACIKACHELAELHCFAQKLEEGKKALATTYAGPKLFDQVYSLSVKTVQHLLKEDKTKPAALKLGDQLIATMREETTARPELASQFLYQVADLHATLGRPSETMKVYQEIGEKFGMNDGLRGRMADWHLSRDKPDQAYRIYGEYENKVNGLQNIAKLQMKQGKVNEAIETYRQLIEIDGESSGNYLWTIAGCYEKLSDWKKAIACYRQVDRFPANYFAIANCHRRLGEQKEAIILYNQCKVVEKSAPEATLQIGFTYEEAKDKEKAIRTFQLTCKRYPKSGQASRAHSHLQNKYNINVTLGGTEEE